VVAVRPEPAHRYRTRAAGEREAAQQAATPNSRQRHLEAAEVWDRFAEQAERAAAAARRKRDAERRISGTQSRPRVSRKRVTRDI